MRAELFLQRTAGTRFQFPSETLDLGPQEVLVVPARVYHAETVWSAGESPFRNVVVYADEGTLSCHLAETGPRGKPRVAHPERVTSSASGRVAAWLEDAVRVSRDWEMAAVAVDLVRASLAVTLELLEAPSEAGEPLPVVRCRRMIHEDLGDPNLSVASLAQRIGCSADYLSHLFATVSGTRLTAHIEDLRMLRAADLLDQTSLSCKEIAWASGYANQSYFIRCFRHHWGMTPGDYRTTKR